MGQGVERIVTTCTRDCPSACGLVAEVRDGRVVKLVGNPGHPLNRGGACRKTPGYLRRVYSPERVTTPLRRIGGVWRRVGWAEALDVAAERLMACVSESGPESILYYQGFGERTALKMLGARFFAHLGGAASLAGTLCGGTGYAAMSEDFGPRVSHDPLDHVNSASVILWGRNPTATQFGLAPILRQARKNGARVIVVDPCATESLCMADAHVRVRPGADLFLALAVAKLVVNRGWEDLDFAQNHAEGYREYRALLDRFSMDELRRACDVGLDKIRLLADAVTEGRPAAILLGWGLHRFEMAHEAVRAIDALSALSGNIGVSGGGVSQGFEEWGPYDQTLWGGDICPPRRTFRMPLIGRELLAADPPVRMIVVTSANPVCMAPDSASVAAAFDRAFVVHMNHFLDDTSDHADLFLPCATFLEDRDIVAAYGHNYVGPVNPAIAPVGECRSQFDIFMDLAGRFPFAADYVRDRETWLRRLVAPLLERGVAYGDLWRGPVRIPDAPMVPWSDRVFATPSGRFRFLQDIGTPLSPGRDPAYPYHFITAGSPEHLCSELTLAEHAPLPVVTVQDAEASRLGIGHGEEAVLKSRLGEMRVVVRHDARQRPDVVRCARGGWIKAGHGVNRLIPAVESRLGQGTAYHEARVALAKAG